MKNKSLLKAFMLLALAHLTALPISLSADHRNQILLFINNAPISLYDVQTHLVVHHLQNNKSDKPLSLASDAIYEFLIQRIGFFLVKDELTRMNISQPEIAAQTEEKWRVFVSKQGGAKPLEQSLRSRGMELLDLKTAFAGEEAVNQFLAKRIRIYMPITVDEVRLEAAKQKAGLDLKDDAEVKKISQEISAQKRKKHYQEYISYLGRKSTIVFTSDQTLLD
jgi:hypothetical protein